MATSFHHIIWNIVLNEMTARCQGRVKHLVEKLNGISDPEINNFSPNVSSKNRREENACSVISEQKNAPLPSKIPNRCHGSKSSSGTLQRSASCSHINSKSTHTQTASESQEFCLVESTFTDEEYNDEDAGILNSWTKIVGIENLYTLLSKKHLTLQQSHHELQKKFEQEQEARSLAEKKLQEYASKDVAYKQMQDEHNKLKNEMQELKEQNELLEFRLLEMEDSNEFERHLGSNNSGSSLGVFDDISDSGVMSMSRSPCEDVFSDSDVIDFKADDERNRVTADEIQEKLLKLYHHISTENTSDRIVIGKAIDTIKYYKMRITCLETTLTAMCQERLQSDMEQLFPSGDWMQEPVKATIRLTSRNHGNRMTSCQNSGFCHSRKCADAEDIANSAMRAKWAQQYYDEYEQNLENFQSEYSDGRENVDCFGEKIFCGNNSSSVSSSEDDTRILSREIDKLERIKKRIEQNRKSITSVMRESCNLSPGDLQNRQLAFYRDQYEEMRRKLAIYEENAEPAIAQLRKQLQREIDLENCLKQLTGKFERLKIERNKLEEEKCEFEEAENDTRLRCQKLEVKLQSALEKKNDLQIQLQRSSRTIANLNCTLAKMEKAAENLSKDCHADDAWCCATCENTNFELEERETEARYRAQLFEYAIPSLIAFNAYNTYNYCVRRMATTGYWVPKCLTYSPPKLKLFRDADTNTEANYATISQEDIQTRQKRYEETLHKADEIITAFEENNRNELERLKSILEEKVERKLRFCEERLVELLTERKDAQCVRERLQCAEIEISNLRKMRQEEEANWLRKERNRVEEIDNLIVELTCLKQNEELFERKYEEQKAKSEMLESDLRVKMREFVEFEENHSIEVKSLRNQIQHFLREVENLEVTNSELREEVETLEGAVNEWKKSAHESRDHCEQMMIAHSREMVSKRMEIDALSRRAREYMAPNAAQEIQYAFFNSGSSDWNHFLTTPRNRCKYAAAQVPAPYSVKNKPKFGSTTSLNPPTSNSLANCNDVQRSCRNAEEKIKFQNVKRSAIYFP